MRRTLTWRRTATLALATAAVLASGACSRSSLSVADLREVIGAGLGRADSIGSARLLPGGATPQFNHPYRVLSVVRDTTYASPSLSQSEQFRLVLGTFEKAPTTAWLALHPDAEKQTYRFRALVRVDPFTKSYEFVRADVGLFARDLWLTNTIE